jgi:hypothetical protein
MRTARIALTATVAALALLSAAPVAQDHPILVALQDELKRSMDGLRMKDQPPPYFIAFRVEDLSSASVVGSLGAIVQDVAIHTRTLQVEVRVGDYAFDSSRFISGAGPGGVGVARMPIDDDVSIMRRQIWLTADTAYKRAVNVFSRKKAAFQNRVEADPIPDFSRETPVEKIAPALPALTTSGPWADRIRQVSAVFVTAPEIQGSDVVFSETRGTRYFVNSEGFKHVVPTEAATVRVLAEALAGDGTVVRDALLVVGRSSQDLPSAADLIGRTKELTTRLTALRTAPAGDAYTGPVLVDGEGAADLLTMTFAPLLTSRRPPETENTRMAASAQSMTSPYLTRIGSRVLPEPFSVSDTPSVARYEGATVAGAYEIDDEGVAAQDVTLIDNGMLKTLLTSRTPQQGLLQSNGHARGGSVLPSVFQVRSARAIPSSALKQKYLDMLKQQGKTYGYIVRAVVNPGAVQAVAFDSTEPPASGSGGPGGTLSAPQILRAVRVTPDGKEEPVRGLQFGPITHTAFRTLAEASVERPLFNTRMSGGTVVSVMVPSLIFEELEIQKSRGVAQKPPIVPTPVK